MSIPPKPIVNPLKKPATVVDILVSILIPLVGVILGFMALVKGERNRSFIILSISFAMILVGFIIYMANTTP